MRDEYQPVHAYGGREHDQPSPVEGCLLCRAEAAEASLAATRAALRGTQDVRDDYKAKLAVQRLEDARWVTIFGEKIIHADDCPHDPTAEVDATVDCECYVVELYAAICERSE